MFFLKEYFFSITQYINNNYQYMAILALIFITVSFAVGSIYFIYFRRNIAAERLAKLSTSSSSGISSQPSKLLEKEGKGIIAKATKALHELDSPKEEVKRKKIRENLMQAGFRSKQSYRNFLAANTILCVLLPCSYLISQAFIFTPRIIVISCILVVVGYYTPKVILSHFRQKRQEKIFKGLPDALDLMVICVAAGLGLDMTFKRVGDELRSLCKDLSDEFYLTNLEIRAGLPRERS